jgi:hypothetical protein
LNARTPPRRAMPKSPDRCSTCSLNWGRQRQVDITHQPPQNIDHTNPPPAKPSRAASDEARSNRARTLEYPPPHLRHPRQCQHQHRYQRRTLEGGYEEGGDACANRAVRVTIGCQGNVTVADTNLPHRTVHELGIATKPARI